MTDQQLHNEGELLNRVANANEAAFRELMLYYNKQLSPFILQFTKSKEKTEEIIQDIFMQVWTTRETLSEIKSFRKFLFVVSRNHALNAIRDMMREQKRLNKYTREAKVGVIEDEPENIEPFLGLIDEAVEQLPTQQKQVWILSRRQGKKHREIAQEMDISQETVKKYVQYANASIMKFVKARVDLMLAGILFMAHQH